MQAKMKQHQLSEADADAFLDSAHVGRLATLGKDGYPYIVPVHFAFMNGMLYFHGLHAGDKLANIAANSNVGFEVDALDSLRHGDAPCDTGTRYTSVIIKGKAAAVEDKDEVIAALDALVRKYAPQHAGGKYPEAMLASTTVVKITPVEKTGKRRV